MYSYCVILLDNFYNLSLLGVFNLGNVIVSMQHTVVHFTGTDNITVKPIAFANLKMKKVRFSPLENLYLEGVKCKIKPKVMDGKMMLQVKYLSLQKQ